MSTLPDLIQNFRVLPGRLWIKLIGLGLSITRIQPVKLGEKKTCTRAVIYMMLYIYFLKIFIKVTPPLNSGATNNNKEWN